LKRKKKRSKHQTVAREREIGVNRSKFIWKKVGLEKVIAFARQSPSWSELSQEAKDQKRKRVFSFSRDEENKRVMEKRKKAHTSVGRLCKWLNSST